MIYKLSDAGNVGILVFLVMLGILVSLLNRAGGSAAFGKWASRHIKTRIGAQISVMILGVLIFVDDYFNCLTVGSVMRPVTDRHKVSRANYLILLMQRQHRYVSSHQSVPGQQQLLLLFRQIPESMDLRYLSRQFHITYMHC